MSRYAISDEIRPIYHMGQIGVVSIINIGPAA